MLHMLQSNPKMFPQKVILTRFHKMVPTCSPEHNPSYPDMLAPTHRIIADRKTPVESFFVVGLLLGLLIIDSQDLVGLLVNMK